MMATFEVWRAHFLSWSSSPSILSWNLARNRHVRRIFCLTLYLFIHYSLIPKVITETSVGHSVVVYTLLLSQLKCPFFFGPNYFDWLSLSPNHRERHFFALFTRKEEREKWCWQIQDSLQWPPRQGAPRTCPY